MKKYCIRTGALGLVVMGIASMASAQTPPPVPALPQTPTNSVSAPPTSVTPPPDYVIGPEDVVAVMFWRDQEMSGDYVVRPDGVITLPLLSDVMAAGLTPEQLRDSLTKEATKFLEDPNVTVGIKAINSRKVHITGMVSKPGVYPLTAPTTVLQLIATAGGLQEFADSKKIIIVRMENGRQVAHKFNYNDVKKGKNLAQNIQLKPGDSIIVP